MSTDNNTSGVLKKAALLSIALLMVVLFISCGGGTRGTGGKDFVGRILNINNAPVPGVKVTVLESGDSTFSDTDGNFELQTRVEQDASLLLEKGTFSARAAVGNLPAGNAKVTVKIRIDEETESAEVESVESVDLDANQDPVSDNGTGSDKGADSDKGSNSGSGEGSGNSMNSGDSGMNDNGISGDNNMQDGSSSNMDESSPDNTTVNDGSSSSGSDSGDMDSGNSGSESGNSGSDSSSNSGDDDDSNGSSGDDDDDNM